MDSDLSFLRQASNEDLDPLVGYILNAEISESLSDSDEYKSYHPDHRQYVDLIDREIRDFGGNTFANAFRSLFDMGHISYEEVVHDVADKMDVKYEKHNSVEAIEDAILFAVLAKAWPKMTEEERKEFYSVANLKVDVPGHIPSSVPAIALQAAIRMGGFASYQLAVIVANAVAKFVLGRGLSFAATATLTRSIAVFAGPIGWAITGLWTAIDLAGPAYRVTIPCVIQIAMLRHKYSLTEEQRTKGAAADSERLGYQDAERLGYEDSGRIGYHD